jgi:putative restriction endonuclease
MEGEGARIWNECLALAPLVAAGAGTATPAQERWGEPVLVRTRLGQGAFRVAVTDAYGRARAATGEHSLPALEAAHIMPFNLDGPHTVNNGLLLRSDLHRLFDRGYVTVTPDYRLEVGARLKEHFQNGRTYYPFHGQPISPPDRVAERPDPDLLRWHNEHLFLG